MTSRLPSKTDNSTSKPEPAGSTEPQEESQEPLSSLLTELSSMVLKVGRLNNGKLSLRLEPPPKPKRLSLSEKIIMFVIRKLQDIQEHYRTHLTFISDERFRENLFSFPCSSGKKLTLYLCITYCCRIFSLYSSYLLLSTMNPMVFAFFLLGSGLLSMIRGIGWGLCGLLEWCLESCLLLVLIDGSRVCDSNLFEVFLCERE